MTIRLCSDMNYISSPIKVAVIGHSYVRRLEQFSQFRGKNLGFTINSIKVEFLGLGGASLELRGSKCACQLLDGLRDFVPTVVLIYLGENDVCRTTPSQIISFLWFIQSVRVVIVCDLLSFTALVKNWLHQEYIDAVNNALSTFDDDCIDVDIIYCWKHRIGVWHPEATTRIFHQDGVHSTMLGMQRYWKSVRTAVGKAVQKVTRHIWMAHCTYISL